MPQLRQEDEKKYCIFTIWPRPDTRTPANGGHEIYNFGRPFYGNHCYALNLSKSWARVEKKLFKEILHFHFMTYMATP